MKASMKKLVLKYVYFSLALYAMFLLLSLSTVLSRKSWTLGLKTQIQETLDTAYPEKEFTVEEAIQIEQPISVSAACYRITDPLREDRDNGRAVIIRITGIAGPQATLFIRKPGNNEFEYVGVTSDEQFYDSSFSWYGVSYRQIKYWKKQIPLIIGEAK